MALDDLSLSKKSAIKMTQDEPSFASTRPQRVLYIEDNQADAEYLREILSLSNESHRFWLVHVKTLAKAIKLLQTENFEAAILDLSLPDSSGLDSLDNLRKAAPSLPILVLTHVDDQKIGIEAVRRGAQEFLIKKSLHAVRLVQALQYAIERQRINLHIETARHRESVSLDVDPVTGLLSRSLFYHRMHQALSQAKRDGYCVALAFLNVDRFRSINDAHGRQSGDMVLKGIADRLLSSLRESDSVTRLWGDQFGILINGMSHPLDEILVANKIRGIFEVAFSSEQGTPLHVTASLGLAMYPNSADNLTLLSRNADTSLHRAKVRGKNQVQFFSEEVQATAARLQEQEATLLSSLDSNDYRIELEKIVDPNSGSAHSLLAHWFWRDQKSSEIEQTLLRFRSGHQVFRALIKKACLQAKSIDPNAVLSFPFPGLQLARERLDHLVSSALSEINFPITQFRMAVPVSAFTPNSSRAIRSIASRFREMGAKFVLNHFTTELISLEVLQSFPVECLLYTRSVKPKDNFQGLQDFAKSLGLKVGALESIGSSLH